MKVGDLIFDASLGRSGIVLEITDEPPEDLNSCWYAHRDTVTFYTLMYDDGMIDHVCDYEVTPLEGKDS